MKKRWFAAVVVLAVAAGCNANQREFTPPPAPTVSGYGFTPPPETASADVAGGAAQRFRPEMEIPAQWWTLFHSPELNALALRAIRANPDLAAAQAALRGAHELVLAQRGARYPSIDGAVTVSEQRNPSALAPPLANNSNVFSLSTAQVNVAYAPDVFHGVRYQIQTVAAQAEAQRFQVAATYIALTGNLVNAAVGVASLRAQIAATQRLILLGNELLEITRRQKTLGQAAGLDVLAQESALASLEQTLPPLQKQLAVQHDLVAALAGSAPGDVGTLNFELAALHLPEDLPLSLPSKLVEQRPDVRAADANLESAGAQVGVAAANRWPSFPLTATMGSVTTTLLSFLTPGSFTYNLVAGVTQPIFDGGTLKHRQKAAEAVYDQALAQYRSAVLSAFQNVADSLHALDNDAETLRAATKSERAAAATLAAVRAQQRLGQVAYPAVVSARQAEEQATLALVQARAARYTDTAALLVALGGGWWRAP
ncbi:MAG: efflux transporter outer membrane subunit [Candidatus Eremiobacteraeota bacterium]|nr:efflux transporter outer membrane subunit [Candidatus Eremiobacteraeota bacterium]